MTSMLSEHLSVAEFLATQHRDWARANVDMWDASDAVRSAAEFRLAPLFEEARSIVGLPMHISSGYRCPGLNATVGGRPTSRHVLGLAVDIVPVGIDAHAAFRLLAAAMKRGALARADELILEMGWVHLQAAPDDGARRLALVTEDGRRFKEWTA